MTSKKPVELNSKGLRGLKIVEIARRLCDLAKEKETKATFNFNDFPLEAAPTTTPEQVVLQWANQALLLATNLNKEQVPDVSTTPPARFSHNLTTHNFAVTPCTKCGKTINKGDHAVWNRGSDHSDLYHMDCAPGAISGETEAARQDRENREWEEVAKQEKQQAAEKLRKAKEEWEAEKAKGFDWKKFLQAEYAFNERLAQEAGKELSFKAGRPLDVEPNIARFRKYHEAATTLHELINTGEQREKRS